MICTPCKNQRHDECPTVDQFPPHPDPFIPAKDKTWCDCQHRTLHRARVTEIGRRIVADNAEILARLKENDK
jgi:hypothetical protein